jgi:hypothetical protein
MRAPIEREHLQSYVGQARRLDEAIELTAHYRTPTNQAMENRLVEDNPKI